MGCEVNPGRRATGIGFTAGLLLLIGFAVETDLGAGFMIAMFASALGAFAFFSLAFPGSLFFSLALANSLAVYVSIFAFFRESNFPGVSNLAQNAGFVLPLAGFMAGAWLRRRAITAIVRAERVGSGAEFRRVTLWLLPIALVGGATFALPADLGPRVDWAFLAAMAAIGAVVFATARDVAVFLIDAGLLFEEFFERIERLILPVYAFLTFYSLLVVSFAAVYKLIDDRVGGPHFRVLGEDRAIGFSDALYFSIVTLSTVGYGDVLPVSDMVRLVASLQVVFGVTLLLMGVSEIMSYSRDLHARRTGRKDEGDVR
jgi:voltage-gated potassium channel